MAQPGNHNHEEATVESRQSHGNVPETERPLLETVCTFADVWHVDLMGLEDGLGQAAHQDGAVVAEDDVPRLELTNDPFDVEGVQDGVEVSGIHAAVEKPGRIVAGIGEHVEHGTADTVVPAAIVWMNGGEDLVPEGEISMFVVEGVDLDGVKSWPPALVPIASIADDVEEVELLSVELDNVGGVDGDEGHIARDFGDRIKPSRLKPIQIGAGIGKTVVERSDHLAQGLCAGERSRDVTDLTATGLADTENAVRCEGGLTRVHRSFSCQFLDKTTYSSDSSPHQAPPFVVQSRLEVIPNKQSQDYVRRRNFSAFSPPGGAASVINPDGLKWKLQHNQTDERIINSVYYKSVKTKFIRNTNSNLVIFKSIQYIKHISCIQPY